MYNSSKKEVAVKQVSIKEEDIIGDDKMARNDTVLWEKELKGKRSSGRDVLYVCIAI